MSDKTGIQWTDATWNPIRGCSRVSDGCRNCYAEVVAARFSGPGQPYEGLARRRTNGESQWTGVVRVIESHMLDPIRWRRPRKIFVNSMSDLFHENVTDETIDRVFAVAALTPWHTHQILTKRPERALAYMTERFQQYTRPDKQGPVDRHGKVLEAVEALVYGPELKRFGGDRWWTDTGGCIAHAQPWPLPNVWLGVSVEHQDAADERLPLLSQTPAAVRWLSMEPLLGHVELGLHMYPGLHWIVVGGESGPEDKVRPFNLAWARSIAWHCRERGVPLFVKQLGRRPFDDWDFSPCGESGEEGDPVQRWLQLRDPHGGDMSEWPADLRVREFPAAVAHA